jgi:hypothetical protein
MFYRRKLSVEYIGVSVHSLYSEGTGAGVRTLPRKFDAVHRNTTTSRRAMPRVRRAMPRTFGLGASVGVAIAAGWGVVGTRVVESAV